MAVVISGVGVKHYPHTCSGWDLILQDTLIMCVTDIFVLACTICSMLSF